MSFSEIAQAIGGALVVIFMVYEIIHRLVCNSNSYKEKLKIKNDEEKAIRRKELDIFIQQLFGETTKTLQDQYQELLKSRNRQDEVDIRLLRSAILDVYFRNKDKKMITFYEKELVLSDYELYHNEYKQNSFITSCIEEIQTWAVL